MSHVLLGRKVELSMVMVTGASVDTEQLLAVTSLVDCFKTSTVPTPCVDSSFGSLVLFGRSTVGLSKLSNHQLQKFSRNTSVRVLELIKMETYSLLVGQDLISEIPFLVCGLV